MEELPRQSGSVNRERSGTAGVGRALDAPSAVSIPVLCPACTLGEKAGCGLLVNGFPLG